MCSSPLCLLDMEALALQKRLSRLRMHMLVMCSSCIQQHRVARLGSQ
jgi:hypothetical protein